MLPLRPRPPAKARARVSLPLLPGSRRIVSPLLRLEGKGKRANLLPAMLMMRVCMQSHLISSPPFHPLGTPLTRRPANAVIKAGNGNGSYQDAMNRSSDLGGDSLIGSEVEDGIKAEMGNEDLIA